MIVSNVLTEEKKQQVLTLGRLGWSLRRIEKQTAAANLKAAGIAPRPPGAWGKRAPPKPANVNYYTTRISHRNGRLVGR